MLISHLPGDPTSGFAASIVSDDMLCLLFKSVKKSHHYFSYTFSKNHNIVTVPSASKPFNGREMPDVHTVT
jgi:uncharacterized protein YcgL (UPF0745 family)